MSEFFAPVFQWFVFEDALLFMGLLSGLLSLGCFLPYIAGTIRGRVRPDRASWLIWSVLGSISFFSQQYEGATVSLVFAAVQVSGTIIVFVLSIWCGAGAYLSRRNLMIFAIASVGLVAWYMMDTAVYALAISIGISLLGGTTTVHKSYVDPESEMLPTWVVALVASVLAVLSVGKWDPILLAYPLYLCTLYVGIVTAILLGRARLVREAKAADKAASDEMAVFIRAPVRVWSTPEGQIFNEGGQLPAKQNVQVPAEHHQIKRNDHGDQNRQDDRELVAHAMSPRLMPN